MEIDLIEAGPKRMLLERLKRRGQLSLDDAIEATGLARTTLRDHLNVLAKDGLVRKHSRRQGRGRPILLYRLTERGSRLFAVRDGILLKELLGFLKKSDQTMLLEEFFEAFWDRRLREAEFRLENIDAEDEAGRLEVIASMLEEQGFMPEIHSGDREIVIRECNCPFPEAVRQTLLPCRLEARFFQRLLQRDMRRVSYIPENHSACTYTFSKNTEDHSGEYGKSPDFFGLNNSEHSGDNTMESILQTSFRDRSVGDVVSEDYRRAGAFKRFGIDFCCGGGQTVQAACEKAGVAYEELEQALIASEKSRSGTAHPDPAGWDLDFLADYIVNVHHSYVRETLPMLQQFSGKVARVHGEGRPELVAIASLVEELAVEMAAHMIKEEQVLFPYVRELVATRKGNGSFAPPVFGTAKNPIRAMEHEHDHAGDIMRQIRELSSDYAPPEWACNTYRASFVKLEEFEEDLHRHVHLENNILFPQTESLEQQLADAS